MQHKMAAQKDGCIYNNFISFNLSYITANSKAKTRMMKRDRFYWDKNDRSRERSGLNFTLTKMLAIQNGGGMKR